MFQRLSIAQRIILIDEQQAKAERVVNHIQADSSDARQKGHRGQRISNGCRWTGCCLNPLLERKNCYAFCNKSQGATA